MSTTQRHYNFFDRICMQLDQVLQIVTDNLPHEGRESPAKYIMESTLTDTEKRHAAGLMRVNHAGEIAAQALYQGQGLTAKLANVRGKMQEAAKEEIDHLRWCSERVNELGSHISYLTPFWYLGSFILGAMAGLCGDGWSLGFLAETEQQVVNHLQNHLQQLPMHDAKSQAIVIQMRNDEDNHRQMAIQAGAKELPNSVKKVMKKMAKVMTTTAYWI